MTDNRVLVLLAVVFAWPAAAQADIVTDWNATLREVIQHNGTHPVNQANPGWSTRSIALMNGAIYDTFQSIDRTHAPFHYKPTTSGASLEAAVHKAARDLLIDCYTHVEEQTIVENAYIARTATVTGTPAEIAAGVALGEAIAQAYINKRLGDHSGDSVMYTPQSGPGKWRPDPYNPGQEAWGPGWGTVHTWAIPDSASFVAALPPPPDLNSDAYTEAYNQVKDYGVLLDANHTTTSRTTEQEDIGLFWGYDRASMGPPPVLFNRNLSEIAVAVGNSPEQNARMFALASIAQADAATAAWNAKFYYNLWRPVAAILEGDTDGNPDTEGDPTWKPLGAPGGNPATDTDDFTPPFPAWTSGHATMGGAIFKALELFYGTNDFSAADATIGADPVDGMYTLTSEEFDVNGVAGMNRDYLHFIQDYSNDPNGNGLLDPGEENSPEGENGMSRVYLGIHWIFDQRDGITLGNNVAQYVNANYFYAVPEPSAVALGLCAVLAGGLIRRRQS